MICTLFGRLIYTFPFIASVGKILEILAIGRTLESLWKIGSDKSENIQDRCLGDLCFHKSVLVNLQLKPSVSCQQVFHWLLPLCCGSCAWEKERLVACAGQLTSAFSSNASDSWFFFFSSFMFDHKRRPFVFWLHTELDGSITCGQSVNIRAS